MEMTFYEQIVNLFLLSIPIACISWTVTHEEVFREPREFCVRMSKESKTLFQRKFFYLFTCEYCFSHYIVIFVLIITHYKLLFGDWRGYLLGGFSLVWIANIYMSLYSRVRIEIKKEKTEISLEEAELKKKEDGK
jgi:hypothetical protein